MQVVGINCGSHDLPSDNDSPASEQIGARLEARDNKVCATAKRFVSEVAM